MTDRFCIDLFCRILREVARCERDVEATRHFYDTARLTVFICSSPSDFGSATSVRE